MVSTPVDPIKCNVSCFQCRGSKIYIQIYQCCSKIWRQLDGKVLLTFNVVLVCTISFCRSILPELHRCKINRKYCNHYVIFSPQDGKVCYCYYCKPCCVSYGTEHSLPLENSLAVFHGSWKPSQTPITVCLCQHLETTSAPLAVCIV